MSFIALTGLFVAFFFIKVDRGNYPNHQSTWVVAEIQHKDRVMASYMMNTTDTTDLNSSNTWLIDSIGRFEIGDTVVFEKKN